jgi:hypothetical protein
MEETAGKYNKSHCEERSDAAIFVILFWIVDYHASRGSARNDLFLSCFLGGGRKPGRGNPI